MEKKYKTTTPLEELKQIHEGMLYRLESRDWKDEIRTELEEVYKESENEDLEESEDDEDDDDSEDE